MFEWVHCQRRCNQVCNFFLRCFTVCRRDSCWTSHIAADIYLIEIRIPCFIKQIPLVYFLVKNEARNLNIHVIRQPPIHLWSRCQNKDEENTEPKNVEKANPLVGVGPTSLKPISAYTHLSHVSSNRNIYAY